jgi:MFS family permease
MAIIDRRQDPMAIVGVAIVGFGGGVFLAVDWALMTEIIPKASAGRYMGMSNIVEATNGPIATAVGAVVMYLVAEITTDAIGGRAAMLSAIVLFGLGALLLVPVREPSRSTATSEPAPA